MSRENHKHYDWSLKMFDEKTIAALDNYVYLLRDPRGSKEFFYVGKGKGNRVFQHEIDAEDDGVTDEAISAKVARIQSIKAAGLQVEQFILRHGLSEGEAFHVESAVIDMVGVSSLSNLQRGHYSTEFGLKSADEIRVMYSAKPFDTDLPVILININRLFDVEMTAAEMYDATRKSWVMGPKRNKALYAVATYRGLTREAYKINDWFQDGKRWGFNGVVANEDVRINLTNMSIAHLSKRGAANPIRYHKCD
jgi:hypothetical protein